MKKRKIVDVSKMPYKDCASAVEHLMEYLCEDMNISEDFKPFASLKEIKEMFSLRKK